MTQLFADTNWDLLTQLLADKSFATSTWAVVEFLLAALGRRNFGKNTLL